MRSRFWILDFGFWIGGVGGWGSAATLGADSQQTVAAAMPRRAFPHGRFGSNSVVADSIVYSDPYEPRRRY